MSAVHAWTISAIVNVDFAISAGKSEDAGACVTIRFVGARAAVQARLGSAFIQIGLAIDAGVTWITDASVTVDLIQALGVVAARIGVTFVDIDLAILAGVTRFAGAGVIPRLVGASAAVEARPGGAVIAIWASATHTRVFIVRAIVFFVLIPDAVGQFLFSSEAGKVGCVDVDRSSSFAEQVDTADFPSVVV